MMMILQKSRWRTKMMMRKRRRRLTLSKKLNWRTNHD
jgi:hypothetical protein